MGKEETYLAPPQPPPNRPSSAGGGSSSGSTNPFLDSAISPPLNARTLSSSNPFRSASAASASASSPEKVVPQNVGGVPNNGASSSSGAGSSSNSAPAPATEDSLDVALPDEPPPAYTPAAGQAGSTTIQAGPSRMDFSGPPPLPDRFTQNQGQSQTQYHAPPPNAPPPPRPLEANITGVGVGYGPRIHPQQTGASSGGGGGFSSPPGPPPPSQSQHSQLSLSPSGPPPPLPSRPSGSASNGASGQAKPDLSPTEIPTPGRPLLWKGQLLVYPKGFWCQKCGNTGFKQMDPSNPHETDWKKYGKKYTSALAHSYTLSPSAMGNPSTTEAQNFQRPLPAHNAPSQQQQAWRPPANTGSGSGLWDHPGHHRPNPPPPPPQHQQHGGFGGPGPGPGWGPPPGPMHHQQHQQAPPMIYSGGNWIPANAMVVRPGDPRLGGYVCPRCRGNGRETDWLGFDDGKCWQCRGVGRVF